MLRLAAGSHRNCETYRAYKELKFSKYLETACKVHDGAGSFINVGFQEPFMALVDDQQIRECKVSNMYVACAVRLDFLKVVRTVFWSGVVLW